MQNKTRLKVSFQCTHCEKKFSRDLNLKFHEVHCHGIVPDRSIFFYCKVEMSSLAINSACKVKKKTHFFSPLLAAQFLGEILEEFYGNFYRHSTIKSIDFAITSHFSPAILQERTTGIKPNFGPPRKPKIESYRTTSSLN